MVDIKGIEAFEQELTHESHQNADLCEAIKSSLAGQMKFETSSCRLLH